VPRGGAAGAPGPGPADGLGEVLGRLGVRELRPGQDQAIAAALAGQDALVVAATGSGKSLCYQAPALCLAGLTVVVSPLIALIEDQAARLRAAGLPVVAITSHLGEAAARDGLAAIRRGAVRLVYCAPERFHRGDFQAALEGLPVAVFAVDEAHCVSEWGHDFRPDYRRLAGWRDRIGARATMALTATATPAVQEDVVRQLALRDPVLVRGGFDRPNLSFDVLVVSGAGATARKWAALEAGLADPGARPAIVYCGTRRATEEVAAGLSARGLRAACYHAGLDPQRRARAQEAFMTDEAEVMAATNAFGMGVDKAGIRSVWHWAVPESLEQLTQEAGRAGRDGLLSRTVLLYSAGDLNMIRQRIVADRVGVSDVEALIGRLARLADEGGAFRIRDGLGDGDRAALALAERAGAVELLTGRGGVEGRLRSRTLGGERAAAVAAQVRAEERRRWRAHDTIRDYAEGERCRRREILRHFGDPGPGAPIGRCCDVCDPLPAVPEPVRVRSAGRGPRPAPDPDGQLTPAEEAVFQALRAWRAERTRADGVPAYRAGSDATLRAIARRLPATPDELAAVRGVGPWFVEQYAEQVLELLSAQAGA